MSCFLAVAVVDVVVVFAAADDVGVVDDSVYVDVDFLCLLHFKYVKSCLFQLKTGSY